MMLPLFAARTGPGFPVRARSPDSAPRYAMMRLGLLFGRVDEAREPPLVSQQRADVEERLAAIERGVPSLSLSAPARAARASCRRRAISAKWSVVSSTSTNGQTGRGEQPLVLSSRHEEEVANRRPDRKFVAVEEAGDHNRVGKEQPTTRPQHAGPIAKHTRPVGKASDRVEADDNT